MEKWFIKQKHREKFPKTSLDLLTKTKLQILYNRDIVDIKDIDAIFLTHEHLDHVKGAGVLSRRHNLKVFTTQKTYQAMLKITKDIKSENLYFFENDRSFTFKDLHIEPIKSFHDCVDGSCYNIIGDKKISIVTDTCLLYTSDAADEQ